MTRKISLVIVILNYNAGDYLKKCIDSIEKSYKDDLKNKAKYQITSIVVADNSSTDSSIEFLKARKNLSEPKVILHENGENIGFAAGNNKGVKIAIKDNPDYVLFLNPDTVVYPDVLTKTIDFLENNPKAGIVTPRLITADGKMDEASHRGFPTPWRSFCHFSGLAKIFPQSRFFSGYALGHLINKKTPHQIDSCTGAFLMIRTEIGKQLDWWDEDYFFYGEDLDFCYRTSEQGWKVYFLPQINVLHYGGIASGIKKHTQNISKAKKETKLKAAKASVAAMRIFYQKHYQKKYPYPIRIIVSAGINILEKYRLFKINSQY